VLLTYMVNSSLDQGVWLVVAELAIYMYNYILEI